MLPWLGPWGTGQQEANEEAGLSTGSDHGGDWSCGEETAEKPGPPAQDSPQPQALSPSEPGRKLPPPTSNHLAPERTVEAPVPLSPQMTSQATPSRMTPLPLWDPIHEANARPQLVGPSCGSGASLSGRTLCHPSWPMYDDWGRVPTSGHPEEAQVSKDTGLPVTGYEDVFLLDPLLPCGQRVPLYLSKPPQQACSSTWLSEAEMIALTGLLQMSQGELRPNSLASPLTSTSCQDPGSASEDPGPSGGQSCSGSTDACPTQTPDTHCP
ncbi:histone deacetylase complex subunit SAP25 isoform X2 [Cricetulus griseus]|uniref:Histone deacetylase complex subunit SAP25 isoform X2 n=1 Tax=Cricetulus griseus TaxID=10029 RepID=A0A9J7G3R8_CRIGR|nr:histone deacetylase complex subunit SAP25 isoform X2 [Cricetulus griseus]XP_027272046.1 histone deacetylase complex subunit SAP25 isoform X2 [Cricetulus griseus]